MPAPENRPVSRFRKKSTFYLLALASGIITSIYVVVDDYVIFEMITNPFVFGAFEMVVGFIVTFLVVLALHIPGKGRTRLGRKFNLGYKLDGNFQKLKLPTGKTAIYTLLAGIFATGATILYYYLMSKNGSSVIMPFSQFVLIYLLIGDAISDREKPVIVEIQSIAMIAFGVIIASVSGIGSDGSFTDFLLNVFLIVGPFSLFSAFYIYFQKKALTTKDKQGKFYDSINLRIWTMLIITIGQVVAAAPALSKGGFSEVSNSWKIALTPVIISMLLVFLSIVFYTRALTMGKMSIVKALSSVSVVTTFPIIGIASIWLPNIFGFGGENLVLDIVLKLSGSFLILIGVIALALSETKSILLAKAKQGFAIKVEELTKIKGIESVSFITGQYDLLINIKMRSIGKAFSLVEKSIAKLPWIDDVITFQIMKEYE
ncbi:MAG: hypothetical protein H7644_06310 [Candidatus Heimdallarchaeota archaeon]|nr:hypothetical protein [Candidatus Heimdallarchaeota archaeon]MCK5143360.1 hypothetical protein [Candidatus Heimdallarchaeota archaeon]